MAPQQPCPKVGALVRVYLNIRAECLKTDTQSSWPGSLAKLKSFINERPCLQYKQARGTAQQVKALATELGGPVCGLPLGPTW